MDETKKPDPDELLAHAHDLRRLARALVSDSHTADDLAQDAWVEMLEGRAAPASSRKPSAWIFGLLRNLRRERSRGEGRRRIREARSARPIEVRGEQEIVDRLETFRALARELEQLEEPHRTSLWQRYFSGETSEEIAEREGISPATVRSQWMRALAKLRERLDRREGGRERWLSSLALLVDVEPATRGGRGGATLATATGLLAVVLVAAHFAVPGVRDDRAPVVASLDDESGEQIDEDPDAPARVAIDATATIDPAAPRSPLRLVLVDDFTGESLPSAHVRVRAGDQAGDWTTDEHGRVVTDAFPHGTVGVEVIDDPGAPPTRLAGELRAFRRVRPVVHDGRGEVELALACGPTFHLAFEESSGLRTRGLIARLSAPGVEGPRASATARVRFDESSSSPWVRFGADGAALAGDGPWILRVESSDARLAGEARIDEIRGRHARSIELELVECVPLTVRTRDAKGRPVDARVEVRGSDGSLAASGSTKGGVLELRGLAPGLAHVHATAFGLPAREASLDVRGSSSVLEFVFEDEVPHGRVSGLVRHRLAPGVSGRVVLRDARGIELVRTITNTDETRARETFEFAFEDVPAGEYELAADARTAWRWNPRLLRVRPPAVGLVFEAQPVDPSSTFVVRARDAETGAVLEHFDVRVEVDGAAPVERSTSLAGVTLPAPPRDARIAWTIAASGYVAARGDESAIRHGAARSVLDVTLQRGFGLRVCVVDDATGVPLANADVLADGMVVAHTDAGGNADLSSREVPRTLGVRLADREIVGGDVDPVDGSWRATTARRVEIRLARRP